MVSSVRCFLVQLFLNSIDRISDVLGHAEHVMHLFTYKPCTVCHPITSKKKAPICSLVLSLKAYPISATESQSSMHSVSKEERASSVPQTRLEARA